MEYRKIGDTPVSASAITFGAWAIGGWMWGGADRKDAVEAIKASYDAGVTSIDTAPVYGQGLSEQIVGEAIKGIPRNNVQIMSKFGVRWNLAKGDHAFDSKDNLGNPIAIYKYAGAESIIKECEDSLRRLGTDYIDLYQIHWPDSTTPIQESMEAVSTLLKQGKIRAAGVSNYNVGQLREARKTVNIGSNQVPYSMVERTIENDLVPYCIANNISIIAYSPLQGGLLTGKIKPGHKFAEGDHRPATRFYKEENIARVNDFLDYIRPLAMDKNATVSQVVLRWTIDQPGITIALAGARNTQQALENAHSIQIHLSSEESEKISRLVDGLDLVK